VRCRLELSRGERYNIPYGRSRKTPESHGEGGDDSLTEEAIREAETADLEGTPIRVVRADYLAVIALSVGRGKDFARILALREVGAVEDDQISALAKRHGLADAWTKFLEKFDEA